MNANDLLQAARKISCASGMIFSAGYLVVPYALTPYPASTAQDGNVLGGRCEDQLDWGKWGKIQDAEKAREWDQVVTLQKEAVRAACDSQYRWYGLANALLNAHRSAEASSVLQEMDVRGFDINPESLNADFPAIAKFMESKAFGAVPLGLKIERLKKLSDERRTKFREILNRMPDGEKPPENYVAKDVCPLSVAAMATGRSWKTRTWFLVRAAAESSVELQEEAARSASWARCISGPSRLWY